MTSTHLRVGRAFALPFYCFWPSVGRESVLRCPCGQPDQPKASARTKCRPRNGPVRQDTELLLNKFRPRMTSAVRGGPWYPEAIASALKSAALINLAHLRAHRPPPPARPRRHHQLPPPAISPRARHRDPRHATDRGHPRGNPRRPQSPPQPAASPSKSSATTLASSASSPHPAPFANSSPQPTPSAAPTSSAASATPSSSPPATSAPASSSPPSSPARPPASASPSSPS